MDGEFSALGWWRSKTPDGRLWCESSVKEEVLAVSGPDYVIERLYTKVEYEWRREDGKAERNPA